MKYAWLVIGVLGARFFATAISYPPGDGDLYWQRWLGATILRTHAVPRALGNEALSAPGAPWVPQEWLFGIAAYLGRSGAGWDVFSGACALGALAALALAAYSAVRRGASARAVALCTAFAGVALFESFGVRAQVVAWPMLALLLLLLDSDGPWCYAAIGVAAIWSNWHASAMLAPVIAGLLAAGSALDERGAGPRTRRLAIVAVASLVAICANPFGWDLPRYALGLFNNPIKSYISEWKVTDVDDTSFAFGALPLMLLAAFAGVRGAPPGTPAAGRRWQDLVMLCAFGFLTLSAARNVAIFALVAVPIAAPALSRRLVWFAKTDEPPPSSADRLAGIALPALTFSIALYVGVKLVAAVPAESGLADKPFAALARVPGPHNVFCSDFAWCSLALGSPNERVFLDGRADPYPPEVWNDFAHIIRLDPAWQAILWRRGVDTIVARRGEALDQALALTGGWRPAYADKSFHLWLRVTRAGQAASGRRRSSG